MTKNNSLIVFVIVVSIHIICEGAQDIGVYELHKRDISVNITNFGATLLSVIVPDKNGRFDDIVLGYPSTEDYVNGTSYFGGLLGRVANRIGGAQFTLNGVQYQLPANDHGNTLHGGNIGFHKVIWSVDGYVKDSHLVLSYQSTDGEEGFPGALSVVVTYMLTDNNELSIEMQAKPLQKATPVNLASHTYWNLGGHTSGDILSHEIQIFGPSITPLNDKQIPTGEITAVEGTPYDFLEPRTIGSKITELRRGYDINYVVERTSNERNFTRVAILKDEKSGRKMELWSDQTGVQFYTGNWLSNTMGKEGFVYQKHAGLCLETQGFPDSVNHPNFPSQIVNLGENYRHTMVYMFTAS